QALLEVTAVARPGDERTQVERVQVPVLQRLGHLAGDDPLRETFDDRGLADAGFADQHRVVLGAARQHLHHPFDLTGTADHRIEVAVASGLGEVRAELVEDGRALARTLGRALADARPSLARFPAGVAGQ